MNSPIAQPQDLRGQFDFLVRSNTQICREHHRLVLGFAPAAHFPKTEPGQFVQLACRNPECNASGEFDWTPGARLDVQDDELASPAAVLRRPFSLAGRRDTPGGVELDIIHRVVGIGTDWLSRLKIGDSVSVLGPLGNRFELPAQDQMAILVGGGVGIPPMLYLAEKMGRRNAVAFAGALTRDLLPFTLQEDAPAADANPAEPRFQVAEFSRYRIPSVITTDDGSYGYRGFVTQALAEFLDHPRSVPPVIYTCGPEPMMKRVAEIAADRGLECQIAVERAMACGMGTCQSCCIKVRNPDRMQPPLAGSEWAYRLACTDGPVFRGRDLLW
jgi:dihydroorotate dehydrogenase electron transfer subunit